MADLQQALQRLQRSMTARAAARGRMIVPLAVSADLPYLQTESLSLSLSPSPTLFNLKGGPRRGYLRDQPVRLPNGQRLVYRGEELLQDDWAVWLQLLERVHYCDKGQPVQFSPLSLLKAMGWGTSMHDRIRLRECLERMQASVLKLPGDAPKVTVTLSLIDKCRWLPSPSGRSGRWQVWIAVELRALFAPSRN